MTWGKLGHILGADLAQFLLHRLDLPVKTKTLYEAGSINRGQGSREFVPLLHYQR